MFPDGLFFLCVPVAAQTPYMVKDINDIQSVGGGSNPSSLVLVGNQIFFTASDTEHNGCALWKTDGTDAGPVFLKTFSQCPYYLTNVNGTLFFSAYDDIHGNALWKSDGTAAGTVMVKDIRYGLYGSIISVNGTAFFSADDGVHDVALWKSDGTYDGTVMVKNVWPMGSANLNGTLFFQAYDGVHGYELWKSDGTTVGTVMFKDIYPGSSDSYPSTLTNVNGTLFFSATDGVHGYELWKTDGTSDGTVMVKDICAGTCSSSPIELTNVNGTLFFAANDGVNGVELWKSDGTAVGTVMVKDICPGTCASILLSAGYVHFFNANGSLFFQATDGVHGYELWKSDGTVDGTVMVKDIYSGSSGAFPPPYPLSPNPYMTNVNGTVFFAATDPVDGTELWKSDGTDAGTIMIKDICPGTCSSAPSYLTNLNGTVFFEADDGVHGQQLWKTDGTVDGTVMVKNMIGKSSGSSPSNFADVNGVLFFSANDSVNGTELWKSDGTDAGTVLVKDIYIGASSSSPANLTNVNGTLFFTASDGTNGVELWKSDGTDVGTTLVKYICLGTCASSPSNLTNVNGTLFFTASDGVSGVELWKSDGTADGTVMVKDICLGACDSAPSNLTNVNGTLFFTATDGTNGVELWKSDGTADGTVMVKDICLGACSSSPFNLTARNGTLFFGAFDGQNRYLWKSDGTADDTVLVYAISPWSLMNVNGTLFFNPGAGALWKSDGTPTGTVLVKNCEGISFLTGVNGILQFTISYSHITTRPWYYFGLGQSDGTAAGTDCHANLIGNFPGQTPSISWPTDGHGTLFAVSMAGISSPPNTYSLLGDDRSFAYLSNLTVSGDKLFFTADDRVHGAELWALDLTPTPAAITRPAAGSTLTSSSATFNWSAGLGARQYWIWIGTTPGGMELYNQGQGLFTTAIVNGLPTDGSIVYVRLFTMMQDGSWQFNDYTYTAGISGPAVMISPTNGSTLAAAQVFFTWSNGLPGQQCWLWIGTTPGGADLYNKSQSVDSTYVTVNGLPTNGVPIYVRLFTAISGGVAVERLYLQRGNSGPGSFVRPGQRFNPAKLFGNLLLVGQHCGAAILALDWHDARRHGTLQSGSEPEYLGCRERTAHQRHAGLRALVHDDAGRLLEIQ